MHNSDAVISTVTEVPPKNKKTIPTEKARVET